MSCYLHRIMSKKPRNQRKRSSIKPGRVDGWREGVGSPEELAERVSYAGSGKHKRYPSATGEWIPIHRPGLSECAHYADDDLRPIEGVLRDAIRRACVQWEEGKSFPVRVWAFVNDVLHEARLSNQDTGVYHAFPLNFDEQWPSDPDEILKDAPRVSLPLH